MSRYSLHVAEWSNCKRCDLHQCRTNVVLGRGEIPAQCVFIGEAPGQSEDVCAEPFIGPSGKMLDDIIAEVQEMCRFTYAITNLIGCIPLDDDGDKIGQPPYESVEACSPRLIEFVSMCNPKLIVCVGKQSEEYLDVKYKYRVKIGDNIPRVTLTHPAAILRGNIAAKPLMIKRQVLILASALKKVLESHK